MYQRGSNESHFQVSIAYYNRYILAMNDLSLIDCRTQLVGHNSETAGRIKSVLMTGSLLVQ